MLIITSKKGNTRGGVHRLGRTRSEIEENLKKEWGTSTWTNEQIEKAKYVEGRIGLKDGMLDTRVLGRIK